MSATTLRPERTGVVEAQRKTERERTKSLPRVKLQQIGPSNIRRHFVRAIVRFGVLLTADFATFLGIRSLLHLIRDQQVVGGSIAATVSAVIPEAALGGFRFAAALFIGLVVTGSYGTGDARRDPRRLFLGSALAAALTIWGGLWSESLFAGVVMYAAILSLVWIGLLLERSVVDWFLKVSGWSRPHHSPTVFVAPRTEYRSVISRRNFAARAECRVLGFVDVSDSPSSDALGELSDLPSVLLEHGAETVIVLGHLDDDDFQFIAEATRDAGCEFLSMPRAFSITGVEPRLVWRDGWPFIEMTSPAVRANEQVLKRFLDILVSTIGLILLSPVFLIVTLAIKLTSKGPIFYRSRRWGRFGSVIGIWKFRTMVNGAASMLDRDERMKKAYRTNIKLIRDPRVTVVGKWLRRWSLDELPQLYNVLVGDMSLVGPRPKLLDEEEKYGAALDTVLSVRPGLTGLWQISGRNNTTYEERIALDVQYATHASVWWDLGILLRTVPVVVTGHGAH